MPLVSASARGSNGYDRSGKSAVVRVNGKELFRLNKPPCWRLPPREKKMPYPPRMTNGLVASGRQASPKRGPKSLLLRSYNGAHGARNGPNGSLITFLPRHFDSEITPKLSYRKPTFSVSCEVARKSS